MKTLIIRLINWVREDVTQKSRQFNLINTILIWITLLILNHYFREGGEILLTNIDSFVMSLPTKLNGWLEYLITHVFML